MNPSMPTCTVFSEAEAAEAAAGVLEEPRAGAFFDHLADCPACQARMLALHPAHTPKPFPELPGEDESDSAILDFVSRVRGAVPAFAEFQPGERIDKYEVIERIGKGGTSVVYQCHDPRMDRHVAVKVLTHQAYFKSPNSRQFQEARTLARLDHPWIVKAFEIDTDHFPPFIVMERVAGGSSSRLLINGPLAPRLAARLVAGVARAVHHAHEQGIVHRDIKPSNLLVVQPFDPDLPMPEDLTLKVSDFGLARTLNTDSRLTHTGEIVGTPAYMSPEQAGGSLRDIGPAADVYSIGVVLYEYLIGRSPLLAENALATLGLIKETEPVPPRQIRVAVPRDLETICLKCLSKDPAERYSSAAALADDLERFLENRPILARPMPAPIRAWRWCRRNPQLAASLLLSAMLMIGSAIGGLYFGIRQSRLLGIAKVATEDANRQRTQAEISRAEAVTQRDTAIRIMDESTTSLFQTYMMLGQANPNLNQNPGLGRIRRIIAEEFLKVANNAESHFNFLQDHKTEYLCGLLFKTGVVQWEIGARKEAVEFFQKVLENYRRIPPPTSELDGLTQQVIVAQNYLGLDQIDKNDPDAAWKIWLECWSTLYARGESWLLRSRYSLPNLLSLGNNLAHLLKQTGHTEEFERIEPQIRHVAQILDQLDKSRQSTFTAPNP